MGPAYAGPTVRRKDLETIRLLLSRRRALQGLGAVLGAAAAGCGDDDAEAGDGTTGSTGSDSSGAGPDSSGSPTSLTSDPDTTGNSASVDSSSSGDGSSSSSGDESSTGDPPLDCEDDGGFSPEELLAEIDTIVVVCMENRSFDHYFGSAAFLEGWQIDGLTGNETNPDLDGNDVQVFHLTDYTVEDPPHGWAAAHKQFNAGKNDGFVT